MVSVVLTNASGMKGLVHVITGNKADNGEIAAQPNKLRRPLPAPGFPGADALRPSPGLGRVLGQAHKQRCRCLPRPVAFPRLLLLCMSLSAFPVKVQCLVNSKLLRSDKQVCELSGHLASLSHSPLLVIFVTPIVCRDAERKRNKSIPFDLETGI